MKKSNSKKLTANVIADALKPYFGIETKHTPGPWKVVNEVQRPRIESAHNGRTIICRVGSNDTDMSLDDDNAALISAAPEMLEALESLLADCYRLNLDIKGASTSMYLKAESAINKARGIK